MFCAGLLPVLPAGAGVVVRRQRFVLERVEDFVEAVEFAHAEAVAGTLVFCAVPLLLALPVAVLILRGEREGRKGEKETEGERGSK